MAFGIGFILFMTLPCIAILFHEQFHINGKVIGWMLLILEVTVVTVCTYLTVETTNHETVNFGLFVLNKQAVNITVVIDVAVFGGLLFLAGLIYFIPSESSSSYSSSSGRRPDYNGNRYHDAYVAHNEPGTYERQSAENRWESSLR